MTREEFDALTLQKESVESKFEALSWEISEILTGTGRRNDGEARITKIENGIARVNYLERASHGSCCGEEWESANIPAHWIFGGDWRAEYAAQKAEEERIKAEKHAADEDRERVEQERRDRDEFERLKAKFH